MGDKTELVIILIILLLGVLAGLGFYLYEIGFENGRNNIINNLQICQELNETEMFRIIEFDSKEITFDFFCYKDQHGGLVFGEEARNRMRLDEFSKRVEDNYDIIYNKGEGLKFENE